MGARTAGRIPAAVTGISIDTRTLEPGDAFFAITGEARNGHDFVADALEKGAALAVVDEAHAGAVRRGRAARGRARRAARRWNGPAPHAGPS